LQKFEQESLIVWEALGITFEEIDRAGVVTLRRPFRLNALTLEMFSRVFGTRSERREFPARHCHNHCDNSVRRGSRQRSRSFGC
jgi:hypothetical protein